MTTNGTKRHRRRKYSAEPLATAPATEDCGPAMAALTEKQRRFVMELRYGPAGYGSEVRAARAAGYGNSRSTDNSMKVTAHQTLHNPKVQNALHEIGGKVIRAEAFQSIKNTVTIANDLTHRDCLKANIALMDRGGFAVETHHTVTVERSPATIALATEQILQRIALLTAKLGLEPVKQIEGTAVAEAETL
jgi:hypothetical protein